LQIIIKQTKLTYLNLIMYCKINFQAQIKTRAITLAILT
jgi:hypothetical protein